MKMLNKSLLVFIVSSLFLLQTVLGINTAQAVDVCSAGASVPPFLASGVDPNLLMIIDNSASMYDLAYVDTLDSGSCFDDTYDETASYGGYFETDPDPYDPWYVYNFTTKQFEGSVSKVDAMAACATSSTTDTEYTANDVCITINEVPNPDVVIAFAARGNLLNWAASSKFDLEKRILTGGKFDSAANQLVMESRGCLDKRFIKQVVVKNTAGVSHFLDLGIQPPQEEEFPLWAPATTYTLGAIVSYSGTLFKNTLAGTSVASATSIYGDGLSWVQYWGTRWHSGTYYPAGTIVTDSGRFYKNSIAGTATSADNNGDFYLNIADDTALGWTMYNVTQIEIFPVTKTGYNNYWCDLLIGEMEKEGGADLGKLITYTNNCMDYSSNPDPLIANETSSFNHSLQTCWYVFAKKLTAASQMDTGDISRAKAACSNAIYSEIDPWMITTDNPSYMCWGMWPHYLPSDKLGFLGRCWEPADTGAGLTCADRICSGEPISGANPRCNSTTNKVEICSGNYNQNTDNCNKPWVVVQDCTGGGSLAAPGWTDDVKDYNNNGTIGTEENSSPGDACIREALWDFCTTLKVPDVVDPTDQSNTSGTNDLWNLPAILADSGMLAQVGKPIAIMKGQIVQSTAPDTGLLHDYSKDLRIGVMAFNDEGSASECNTSIMLTDPHVLYNCANPANQDGAEVLAYIDQDVSPATTHLDAVITAINNIKATSWTPLAEAIFNAIGYYGQDTSRRINSYGGGYDFLVESEDASHPDPIISYCQENNIMIITDGASSADLNQDVITFGSSAGDVDTDPASCGDLHGSTLLDDLSWFAWNGNPWDIYTSETTTSTKYNDEDGNPAYKKNIKTYMVVAGTPRSGGTGECQPLTLMDNTAANGGTTEAYKATDINDLEAKLQQAFSSIRAGSSSGSAASVISSARGGEGAVYQAIFWPSIDVPAPAQDVKWVGEVHSLLIDADGYTHEDTDGNKKFDAAVDEKVFIYFDAGAKIAKSCYGTVTNGVCSGTSKSLFEVKFLWSANEWLAGITNTDILSNRTSYISGTENKRYIFTWDDLNNDGIVDSSEILPFDSSTDWAGLTYDSSTRDDVPHDFGASIATDADVDNIVNWVRGLDGMTGQRSRKVPYDMDKNGSTETDITWRLGDVVHSTPMVVSRPAEGYNFLYRDVTYGEFINKYNNRRTVIYFGGNDGMLHAVNGGFYDQSRKGFCRSSDCNHESTNPVLGAELWAYVPYNLLPHLNCTTLPEYGRDDYGHKYFVDQRPRIFDVQIFNEEPACSSNGIADPGCIHPRGWGTILVGAMRFGGATVRASELNSPTSTDNRRFVSSYFIMDITNPEAPPVLLAEMTNTGSEVNLGYTTPIPTMVPMKDSYGTKWYLVMGSGPTTLKGESTQKPRLGILPLEWLTGATKRPFRIPNDTPLNAGNQGGSFVLNSSNLGFVSDLITVDFELDPQYKADVVYFGTVENGFGNWGGKLYRMVTREYDPFLGAFLSTTPSQWGEAPTAVHPLSVMLDAQAPITAAPSVATDGKNYWVYVGTGRFYDRDDKTDNSNATGGEFQTYYGLKEPHDCNGDFTWKTLQKTGTHALQSASYPLIAGAPGTQGLLRVDQVLVDNAATVTTAGLSCKDGTTNCLPFTNGGYPATGSGTRISNFAELRDWIAGTGCNVTTTPPEHAGSDGWYKELHNNERERNIGQATILGGLVTFTTYQPYDNPCLPEGLGYLYAVHFQTGTANYRSVFGYDTLTSTKVLDSIAIGRGLAPTPNLHVGADGVTAIVQTSTGEVKGLKQDEQALQNFKTGKTGWREGTEPVVK